MRYPVPKGLIMKKLTAIITFSLSLFLVGCSNDSDSKTPASEKPIGKGVLPPAYLTIKGGKACLGTKKMGTWNAVCIPKAKPAQCTDDSWDNLQSLKGTDRPAPC